MYELRFNINEIFEEWDVIFGEDFASASRSPHRLMESVEDYLYELEDNLNQAHKEIHQLKWKLDSLAKREPQCGDMVRITQVLPWPQLLECYGFAISGVVIETDKLLLRGEARVRFNFPYGEWVIPYNALERIGKDLKSYEEPIRYKAYLP